MEMNSSSKIKWLSHDSVYIHVRGQSHLTGAICVTVTYRYAHYGHISIFFQKSIYQSHLNNGLSSNESVIIYKEGNVMQREGQKQN